MRREAWPKTNRRLFITENRACIWLKRRYYQSVNSNDIPPIHIQISYYLSRLKSRQIYLLFALHNQIEGIITSILGTFFHALSWTLHVSFRKVGKCPCYAQFNTLTWLYSDLPQSGHAHQKRISTTNEPFLHIDLLSIVPFREKEAWNELLPGPIPKGCGTVDSLFDNKAQLWY